MGRYNKVALEFFALDVTLSDEILVLEADHGLEGFAVLIKLYQKLYGDRGYYIEWSEDKQKIFARRIHIDLEKLKTIVAYLIEAGLFNKDLFLEYGILTCRRAQEHYFTSTYKRASVTAIREYLLYDVADKRHVETISLSISDDGNEDMTAISDDGNRDRTAISDDESTQSKSKSKVKVKEIEIEDPSGSSLSVSEEKPEKNTPKKTAKKKETAEMVLKDSDRISEDLKPKVKEFIEYREQLKKPMTALGMKHLITDLIKLGASDLERERMLEKAIIRNWQGVFALDEKEKKDLTAVKKQETVKKRQEPEFTQEELQYMMTPEYQEKLERDYDALLEERKIRGQEAYKKWAEENPELAKRHKAK